VKSHRRLFVCGSNDKGQLGLGSTENVAVLKPVKALDGEKVTKALGGWDFTILLNGKYYYQGLFSIIFVTRPHIFQKNFNM
jgi:alpha-tubulin suppressor-like RCC1 family protein